MKWFDSMSTSRLASFLKFVCVLLCALLPPVLISMLCLLVPPTAKFVNTLRVLRVDEG